MQKVNAFWILFAFNITGTYQTCPILITELSQDTCASKSYGKENSFYFDLDDSDCVPKCRNYKDAIYQNCSSDKKCMPGYSCQKRCGPEDNLKQFPCENDHDCLGHNSEDDNSTKCEFYCMAENKVSCMAYHINTEDYRDTYWTAQKFKPSCNNDGTWKAKQCKGGESGRCMCFDSQGNRLFGEALLKDAANMTCACSRRKAELEATWNTTLHCDSMGNYEPLQCDEVSEQCWCAEPTTGDLVYAIVPKKAIYLLPCYSAEDYGSQYLRQCESKKFAQTRITNKFNNHGVAYVTQDFILCNADGSYGPFTIINNIAYCIWRDNTNMGAWQSDVRSGYSNLTCNCARDQYLYAHTKTCLSSGDYKPLQPDSNKWYCVDNDGFAKTIILSPNSTDDSYCDMYY